MKHLTIVLFLVGISLFVKGEKKLKERKNLILKKIVCLFNGCQSN
jgi:uncharacterized membrane protein